MNHTDKKCVAAVLIRTREIVESGFVRGAFAIDLPETEASKRGTANMVSPLDPSARCWCFTGALDRALYGTESRAWPADFKAKITEQGERVTEFVCRFLGITIRPGTYGHVWAMTAWSDRRDKAEVIAGIDSMLESLA